MAQLIFATLCDDIRNEVEPSVPMGRKRSLMGVFDSFLVTDPQQPLSRFHLYAKIGADSSEAQDLVIRMSDSQNTTMLELRGRLAPSPSMNTAYGLFVTELGVAYPHLKFTAAGTARFAFLLNGAEIGELKVNVIRLELVEPPVAPAAGC